jgi:hypothetical protein
MSVSKLILPNTKKPADVLRQEMLDKLGDISGIDVYHNWALGMIYMPDKVGSLYRSDVSKEEDKWQGKSVLLVKVGPKAFQNTADGNWSWDPPITVGDWLVARASDGVNRVINGQMCRLFRDTVVTEKVSHPDNIF